MWINGFSSDDVSKYPASLQNNTLDRNGGMAMRLWEKSAISRGGRKIHAAGMQANAMRNSAGRMRRARLS